MKIHPILLISILLLSLFMTCKKQSGDAGEAQRKMKCESYNNYVYIDGECKCPEGYFETGDEPTDYSCIKKKEGVLLMKSDDCFCGGDNVLKFYSDPFGNWGVVVYSNGNYLDFPTSCQYTPKPDGDEIFIEGTVDVVCADKESYAIIMNGKFNESKTMMDAEVVFFKFENGGFTRIDTCTYVLSGE